MKRLILITPILFILLSCVFPTQARAQDPQFTQFFANPIYIAPSYAGASLGHRVVTSYRDQWSVMPNMYRTLSVSYDVNIASLRSGMGLFVLGDLAGDGNLGTILGGAVYSYSVELTPSWSFRPGIGFYVRHNSINYSKLTWGDQLTTDPPNPTTMQNTGKKGVFDIDVSASLLFHSADAWVGASWDHMLRPKSSFYGDGARIPFRFSVFGGYRFVIASLYRRGIDQSLSLATHARLQGRFSQLDFGGYWFKYPVLLGIWYRGLPLVKDYLGSDALAFMIGCRFNSFQMTYSYDLTVSNLTPRTGGSHEITLTYESKITPKKRRYRPPTCPPY